MFSVWMLVNFHEKVCLSVFVSKIGVQYISPNHPKSSKILQGALFLKKGQHCWKLVLSPLQMGA